jgi:hypothetical protein
MKSVVEDQNIVVLKADMTEENAEIEETLVGFGNTALAIPYYAVYQPGKDPHHFAGNFTAVGAKGFLETAGVSYSNSPSQNQIEAKDKPKADAGVVADARIVPSG